MTPEAALLMLGILVAGVFVVGGLGLTGCLWREHGRLNKRRDRRQCTESI